MNTRTAHEKLDTSFVDLLALVRHLMDRGFIGRVHLEFDDYEADVFLTADFHLDSREIDHGAGRVSAGGQVFDNLLRRAMEPGGTISVFEDVSEPFEYPKIESPDDLNRIPKPGGMPNFERPEPIPAPAREKAGLPEAIRSQHPDQPALAPEIRSQPPEQPALRPVFPIPPSEQPDFPPAIPAPEVAESAAPVISLKERLGVPSLPFSFSNKFEKKAARLSSPPADEWQDLLELTGKLLQTVEACLSREKLNFSWVFDKVRVEVAGDYPFLRPGSTVFEYDNGRIYMEEKINPNVFTMGLIESIGLILTKLEAHPRFATVHQAAGGHLNDLLDKNYEQFERYSISNKLRRVIGL